MLNKFIKRGNRKASKPSDAAGEHQANAGNNDSTVTVNLASRSVLPSANSGAGAASAAPAPAITALSLLRDVPAADRPALLISKLKICAVIFDFSDTLRLARERETKRQALIEIGDFIQSGSAGRLPESVQDELARTVASNIFRPLPPGTHENTGSVDAPADPDEEEPFLEPSWPHLQLVYELLLKFIVSNDTDTKIAKKYIDHLFVIKLLELFDTEDHREREYVKNVLHRIYGKFMVHRPFIRKAINNVLYRFIFETQRHNGIGELLEILGSIINGFAMPMKEEHKLFLKRVLIPLHRPKSVSGYQQQLSYCITQFVEKDYKLADTVVRGLLKYWPVINCQKEVLFLGELEEVLEVTQPVEFQLCMVPLFKRIARCLNSPHFQVAERALFLWNNDHIVSLIAQNCNVILPIIFGALEKNTRNHWNQAVHGLTANVRKMFLEMDAELFEECQKQNVEKEAKTKELLEQQELAWTKLEALVAAKAAGEVLVN